MAGYKDEKRHGKTAKKVSTNIEDMARHHSTIPFFAGYCPGM
jgi:hypothetical protein